MYLPDMALLSLILTIAQIGSRKARSRLHGIRVVRRGRPAAEPHGFWLDASLATGPSVGLHVDLEPVPNHAPCNLESQAVRILLPRNPGSHGVDLASGMRVRRLRG